MRGKIELDSRFIGYVIAHRAARWRCVSRSAKYGLGRKQDVPFMLPGDDLGYYYYDIQLREETERVSAELFEEVTFMRLEVQQILADLSAGKETLPVDKKAEMLQRAMTMKEEMDTLVATLEELR